MDRLLLKKDFSSLRRLLFLHGASGGNLTEYTATGNPASFNTNVAKPLRQMLIPFTPVQSGTGDPSPENVRPIYGKSLMNVSVMGTNIFDGEMENGDINSDTGQNSGTSSSRYRSKNYIPIKAGSYYFHSPGRTGTVRVFVYNSDKTFRLYTTWNVNAVNTISYERMGFIRFRFSSGQVEGDASISINFPSTEADYVPYAEGSNTYPITFPEEAGTVYGGTLDLTTGVLTVDLAVISKKWSDFEVKGSAFGFEYRTYVIGENVLDADHGGGSAGNHFCNCMIYSYATASVGTNHYFINSSKTVSAYMAEGTSEDTDILILAKLVESHEYQLTPQQIQTLIGDNVIFSDTNGENTITYLKKG